jgi:DNA-directed RNA polymerase subunit N
LADKYEEFRERTKKGEDPKKVLDGLGLKRYCCRTAVITSIDEMEEIAKFKR